MIDQLRRTLRLELPITQHLGIEVRTLDAGQVILAAPLLANRNHTGTAFAGSLNALATLAGWSFVWALLRRNDLPGYVLIQDSSITYSRPVTSDFLATCAAPEAALAGRFLAAMRRRGRGRIRLGVTVSDHEGIAATFSGRYVAQQDRGGLVPKGP